jgi:hypothetical protein
MFIRPTASSEFIPFEFVTVSDLQPQKIIVKLNRITIAKENLEYIIILLLKCALIYM